MQSSTPIPPDPSRHLFCFGCGYTARRLARRLLTVGARVSGTSRTANGVDRLAREGIEGHLFDGSAALAASAFDGVTDVLCTIPPEEGGDDGVLRTHGSVLAGLRTLRWAAVLSTTGVYGDVDGAWIDEDAPLQPGSTRGERRLHAEQRWLTWGSSHRLAVQVFRLPGIYGPGRSSFERLRAGTARRIVKAGHVFNRIHVDDIGTALLLAMDRPQAGPIFHLADDLPAGADEVMAHAATLLGMPPPPALPFESAGLSPMAREFYAESKRLITDRAKRELSFSPRYPTYREGLAAILAEEKS